MHVSPREDPKLTASATKFWSPTQTFLTPSKSYPVYAISLHLGVLFYLVVDDQQTPIFVPAELFEEWTGPLPSAWITSTFSGDTQMVSGPAFIAESLEAYDRMIDQCFESVTAFWQHVDSPQNTGRRPATLRYPSFATLTNATDTGRAEQLRTIEILANAQRDPEQPLNVWSAIVVEALRAAGHELFGFDEDGESFELWTTDWSKPSRSGLTLTFDIEDGARAEWAR